MLIHFNSDPAAECDNCGTSDTIMHMSTQHPDRSVSLCIACFRVLLQALGAASEKLRVFGS